MFKLSMRLLKGESTKIWLVLFCVALGVAARVAVGSFLNQLNHSLLKEARVLLSCDVEISSKLPLSSSQREKISEALPKGHQTQEAINFVTMAAAPSSGKSRLAEVRAVENHYPYYGKLRLQGLDGKVLESVGSEEGVYVQKELLTHLKIQVGDEIKLGKKEFLIKGTILDEPGLGANIYSLGPRILIPMEHVQATGLLEFGSRAYYSLLISLINPEMAEKAASDLRELWGLSKRRGRFRESMGPEGDFQVRTPIDKQNQIRKFFERLGDYLRLVSLVALLLGGIGVASVIRSFVVERLRSAATLRTLGASSSQVFWIFAYQVGILGLGGSLLGVVIGLLLQGFLPIILSGFIPVKYQMGVSLSAIFWGLGLGLLVSSFFGLLPILSLKKLKPLEIFRGENTASLLDQIPWFGLGLGVILLSAVSVLESRSFVKGLFFSASFLASAGLLYILSRALLPRLSQVRGAFSSFGLRHGLSNIARPQLHPHGVSTALGLSAFLLGALAVYQYSLLKDLDPGKKPAEIPTFFIIDIQDDQAGPLKEFLEKNGAANSVISPMIKARYRGKNDESFKIKKGLTQEAERDQYFRHREQNLSFRDEIGRNEEIFKGQWIDPSSGEVEASVEDWFAERLNIGMGDVLEFDVQGVPVKARVTSLRRVNWSSFLPTFFVYITPDILREAPKTWVGSVLGVESNQKDKIQIGLITLFPNLTIIDVAIIAEKILGILKKISWAVSFVALFSVIAGLIVLTGMAMSSIQQREKEAVLLKVLGGSRRTIFISLASEFGALSAFSVFLGLVLSSGFSYILLTRLMDLSFSYPWLAILILWATLVTLSSMTGLLVSRRVFRAKPLALMREI